MSANSLVASYSMGIQSAKGTAATAYKTALSTDSTVNVKFDEREPPLEHPAPAARATNRKIATLRTGYMVPVGNSFLARPRYLGTCLRAAGFAVSTVNNTTHYTHTFTLADRTAFAWATVIHKIIGATNLERKVTDVRLETFSLNADTKEIKGETAGFGLLEGDASGSETKVSEIAVELSPAAGSATIVVGGATVASPLRGMTFEVKNEFDQEDKALFSSARVDAPQMGLDITGTLGGVDFDYGTYEMYRRIVRGGTSATAPSLVSATGALSFAYQSASNITGAAVPYSLSVALDTVDYMFQDVQASGNEMIRGDINWAMIDGVTTPITIVLVNDQAAY